MSLSTWGLGRYVYVPLAIDVLECVLRLLECPHFSEYFDTKTSCLQKMELCLCVTGPLILTTPNHCGVPF